MSGARSRAWTTLRVPATRLSQCFTTLTSSIKPPSQVICTEFAYNTLPWVWIFYSWQTALPILAALACMSFEGFVLEGEKTLRHFGWL